MVRSNSAPLCPQSISPPSFFFPPAILPPISRDFMFGTSSHTMYLSLLLLLCSSLLPASTTATCYNPPSQSNKLVAVNTVGTICSGLEGFFRQDEPRDACVTDKATGTEWRFFVERMGEKNTPDGTLDHTSCINAFNQELSKCKQGAGYHELGGFHFS